MPGPVIPVPGQRRNRLRIADFEKKKKSPPPAPVQQPARPPATCCDNPDVNIDDEGQEVCYSCGNMDHQGADIVAEDQFSIVNGRTVMHGGTVGNDQRHANSMGGKTSGIHGGDSSQATVERGRSAIGWICVKTSIANGSEAPLAITAFKYYKLAHLQSFIQGRGILKVACASIYLASRGKTRNTVMLMDLAEAISVNIWTLGKVYTSLCEILMLDPRGPQNIYNVDVEALMLKFCQKLEFDQDSYRVAADACVVLKRMSRDWIVEGRNPAGVCGACILIAARMNNFRRSTQEMVYVCRVADSTINQRLVEWSRTKASKLTVKQFREFSGKLKSNEEPPSVYRRREREEKAAAKKRSADEFENDESDNMDGDDSTGEDADEGTPQPVPSKPTKRQADIMRKKQKLIAGTPAEPPQQDQSSEQADGEISEPMVIDMDAIVGGDAGLDSLANAETATEPNEEAIAAPKKPRGRPPKKRVPIVIQEEDIQIENDLREEMEEYMKNWEDIFQQFEDNGHHPEFLKSLEMARKLVQLHQPDRNISSEEEIGEDEFEDDLDVANCQLSPEESLSKERIWLVENEDWLREQQRKILAKAIEEALGTQKKPKQKRKRSQMGDGSLLKGKTVRDPAEAVKLMHQKRAKHWSSNINYDIFKQLARNNSPEGTATPAEQVATPVPQQQSEPAYQTVPVGDDDEEEEEEEEEVEEEEEEEPENRYLSDVEEGFNEDDENWGDY